LPPPNPSLPFCPAVVRPFAAFASVTVQSAWRIAHFEQRNRTFKLSKEATFSPPIPMPENKTKPTAASVEAYFASRASEQQLSDCRELVTLFKKITRQPAKMWAPSIVGFGSSASFAVQSASSLA
jgi:hypothetical protein